ncbi:MAG: shikimate kinase [Propionibacteriaceae bacterium]|jgi:shikimate kinase|nr:shikimate kinase [Propionibacteriaceae bacterium]
MIVFVGFMGAGKSTIGKLVARRLGLPFVDTDAVIEQRHGPIKNIFADRGEAGFRLLEAAVVREALNGPQRVVALGGGAVTTPQVRQMLRGHEVVWLQIPLQAALARMAGDTERPLLASPGLSQRFGRRQKLYAEVATHVVPVGRYSPSHTGRAVLKALGADPAE